MEIKILGSFIAGVGAVILIVGYFVTRTINQYDLSIKDLYKKRDADRSDLDKLRGEHKAMCKMHDEED